MQGNTNKLVSISTESRRQANLEKWRDDLFKQVKDLSTLYNVEAAVIVRDQRQNEVSVWPSPSAVNETVRKFLNRPDIERTQTMFTNENFPGKETKNEMENDHKEMEVLIHEIIRDKNTIEELEMKQTHGLFKFGEDKMKMVNKRIEELRQDQVTEASGSSTHASIPDPKSIEEQMKPSTTEAE